MSRWISSFTVALVFHLAAQTARADIGDVSFRVSDAQVSIPAGTAGAVAASVNVFVEIEGGGTIPAAGWAAIFEITPSAGATGSVAFDPLPVVSSEPNLAVASEKPFIDFDRDFGGKAFGEPGETEFELHAVAAYVTPTSMPPPTLDTNGNLTLPDGAGLVSLPLAISPFASGEFVISVVENPQLSGVVALTGNPPPGDTIIHPVGLHVAGVVSVESQLAITGDYNADGKVDAADYVVWRKNDGSVAGYSAWRANFARAAPTGPAAAAHAAIPEPTTSTVVLLWMLTSGMGWRRTIGKGQQKSRKLLAS